MSEVFKKAEHKKTMELARRLLAKGYSVRDREGRFGQPVTIAGITPDLVARKGGKTIIVEVKSKASVLKKLAALRELSRYAESHRGYRFDLVVANPPSISKAAAAALDREKRRREMMRRLKRTVARSSVSGRFVQRRYAKRNPQTTEIETIGGKKQKSGR